VVDLDPAALADDPKVKAKTRSANEAEYVLVCMFVLRPVINTTSIRCQSRRNLPHCSDHFRRTELSFCGLNSQTKNKK